MNRSEMQYPGQKNYNMASTVICMLVSLLSIFFVGFFRSRLLLHLLYVLIFWIYLIILYHFHLFVNRAELIIVLALKTFGISNPRCRSHLLVQIAPMNVSNSSLIGMSHHLFRELVHLNPCAWHDLISPIFAGSKDRVFCCNSYWGFCETADLKISVNFFVDESNYTHITSIQFHDNSFMSKINYL